jgi:hypothetical protein
MASFTEAFMASMSRTLDPDYAMAKDAAKVHVEQLKDELRENRITKIQRLGKLIDEGKANGVDGRVIDAYDRLMTQLTASLG